MKATSLSDPVRPAPTPPPAATPVPAPVPAAPAPGLRDAGAADIGIVHGEVAHVRRRPTLHAFRYPAFCLRLPLSALGRLEHSGIAHNRRGWLSFHDRDHGARDGSALLPWIRRLLAAEGLDGLDEVVLYTFPRVLGYVFNPVSFWVCHAGDGSVRAVLCEVSNTFGEHHNYLLAQADGGPLASGATLHARKCFHVSPFCEVQGHYAFRFSFVPGRWLARIDYFDGAAASGPLLETRVSGRVAALDRAGTRALLWRYRLFTLGVIARIHWQALHLWRKGVRYIPKPPPPAQETTR